jgi:hypothetical protein
MQQVTSPKAAASWLGQILRMRLEVLKQSNDTPLRRLCSLRYTRVSPYLLFEYDPQLSQMSLKVRRNGYWAPPTEARTRRLYQPLDHATQALTAVRAHRLQKAYAKVALAEYAGHDRVVNVVINPRYVVRVLDHPFLFRYSRFAPAPPASQRRPPDTPPSGSSEIQRKSVDDRKLCHDEVPLLMVIESAAQNLLERLLASMAKRWMTKVVAQRDGLGQILVEPQRPGCSSR